MPRNKTRAIEDIDISIALANFWISPLIDQCKLNDIDLSVPVLFASMRQDLNLRPLRPEQYSSNFISNHSSLYKLFYYSLI